jgi:hypothetical protein
MKPDSSPRLVAPFAVGVALAVANLGAHSATAAGTAAVNAHVCATNGGRATIPAGSEVEVRLANLLETYGLTTSFLRQERTTIAIDDRDGSDISVFWGEASPRFVAPYGEVWSTRLSYDTGAVLQAGASMHFQLALTAQHLSTDRLSFANGVAGRPALFETGTETFDCTVTAVAAAA